VTVNRQSGPATPISRTLNREECWSLLRDGTLGRVAVVVEGRPHILPVNYASADDDVVFRTAEGTLLDAAVGTPIAFEVDGVDPSTRSGWSVCVHGRSVLLDGAHPDRFVPVDTWAPRGRDRWYRIVAEDITGRRLYGPTHRGEPAGE
jgi:uncharacterized protein